MSMVLYRGSAKNAAAGRWEQSLFRVAFLPAGVTALLSIAAVLVTLLSAGSALTGLFGAIGSVWLAVHQVPVYIGGTDLGALPLLPTLLVFAGVVRCTYRFAAVDASPTRQWQIIGAAVGGPLVITVAALALVADSEAALGISGPGPLLSMAGVAALHGAAAILGVGLRGVWPNASRWGVPTWMLTSLRAGVVAVLAILSAGALLTVGGMLFGWTEVTAMLGAESTVIGQLGLLLLSIMYLPNVMVAGSAVLTGATARIGEASYSLFDVRPGPIPAVPVLGALPQSELGGFWPALLAVCAGIGFWLGWRYRAVAESAIDKLRFFVAAGAVAAMIALALGFLASGEMGSFGYLGVEPPVFAMCVFGWVTVPGLAVAYGCMGLARRDAHHDRGALRDPDSDVEYADDGFEDEYVEDEEVEDEHEAEYVELELAEGEPADVAEDPVAES